MISLLMYAAAGSAFGGVEVAAVVDTVAVPAGCNEAGVCYPAGREIVTTSGRVPVSDLDTFNRLRAGDIVYINHGEVIAREVQ